jgi:hypothetical protein
VKLPVPDDRTFCERTGAALPSMLYQRLCEPEHVEPSAGHGRCCASPRFHEQRRYVISPEVLLLQPRRQSSTSSLSRHQVLVEDPLVLDDGTELSLGKWRLAAIMYHEGAHMQSGRFNISADKSRYYQTEVTYPIKLK